MISLDCRYLALPAEITYFMSKLTAPCTTASHPKCSARKIIQLNSVSFPITQFCFVAWVIGFMSSEGALSYGLLKLGFEVWLIFEDM